MLRPEHSAQFGKELIVVGFLPRPEPPGRVGGLTDRVSPKTRTPCSVPRERKEFESILMTIDGRSFLSGISAVTPEYAILTVILEEREVR